jgi:3-oxochol-4-en-24-oyl-CoA dehydrogenase
VPIAISAEQRALQASIREWAARAGTLALVRVLEPGATAGTPGSPAGRPGSQAGRPTGSAGAPGTPAHPSGPPGVPAGAAPGAPSTPAHRSGVPGAPAGVAHEKAPWAEHWSALAGLGIFSIALPAAAGDAVYAFLLSRCLSIAGGTSQILLSVVAERALGLPRDEAR